MIAAARIAAYRALRAVSSGAADLPHALARARAGLHDERDRALAAEIVTGALRWQAAFDHIVTQFAKRPLQKLDPEILDILRLSIFQLLHLDRVPASAAVNDAVSMASHAGKKSAGPLVNALLRRVSRERDRLPLPPRPDSAADRAVAIDYLSTTLSHPQWLAERWFDRYGFEATERWMQFNNRPASLTLRVNTLKTTAPALTRSLADRGIEVRPGQFSPDALIVQIGNPLLTPLVEDGSFFVQDEASQLVASVVGAQPGDRVLDACASPGGKTIAIAAAMRDTGLIVATDVRGRRVDLLAKTIASSGARSIKVVQADVSNPLPLQAQFDWVLLDAPCSGLGTVRRDPDIRWRRTESDLAGLAVAQLRMLTETARVLRPGGRLVYSTCSSEPDENEHVVQRFLGESGFALAPITTPGSTARSLVNAAGHLRTLPYRDGLEAFFAALLVKP
jgi:16S rRNA (cytosine967-C5)-methyltransferase